MATVQSLCLLFLLALSLSPQISAEEHKSSSWTNTLLRMVTNPWRNSREDDLEMGVEINLKNYCESWRINVELHNIKNFHSVPDECAGFVAKYMESSQYSSDVKLAGDEAAMFVANSISIGGDGRDAWVFDVDETLLSTFPFFKQHRFGGDAANRTLLEEWMASRRAPAVVGMSELFHRVRERGLAIILISWRPENLRAATVDNLIKAGYHGWSKLILRCDEERRDSVQNYKSEQRKRLVAQGYRVWGIAGAQWSSVTGYPEPKRAFKLPNPMYYL